MKVLAATFVGLLLVTGVAAGQVVDEVSRRQALQHYRIGHELMLAERYEQAAAEFTTAIDFDPILTLAHYGRGQAYMALKRYASAVQAFLACREAYQTIAALRQRNAAESLRLQADEINELRDSIRRLQSNQVRVNAATQFRIEQRLEELETLRRGNNFGEAFPEPAELPLALGSAHFRAGHLADAEREWKAAIAMNSKLGEAHNNLAALYAMSGRKREAEAAVTAAERTRFAVHPGLKQDISRMK
jgi:tetratricopeptide (TPR) repeat protein